jgi:hypothetical protein
VTVMETSGDGAEDDAVEQDRKLPIKPSRRNPVPQGPGRGRLPALAPLRRSATR